MLRYQVKDTCAECKMCGGSRCEPARTDKLRSYSGIRPTSDGFDCALPITIDSHSICAFGCYYCFSDNLIQHREGRTRSIGQTSLSEIEYLFAGEPGKQRSLYQKALKYDKLNKNGYPCPIQLGAINDPCDNIERQQGWLLKFIDLAIKYNRPVRISTKGDVFLQKDYLDAVSKAPHLFWVAFSIITPDDKLIEKCDRRAPNATRRLETMAALSSVGVKTSLRFRPILPGLSDSTKRYPKAYRVLVEKAAEAGAVAISYEVGFVPGAMTQDTKWRWDKLSNLCGVDFDKLYRTFGRSMACMRPPYTWTEGIMHAIRDVAHECGMDVGVSDPVWKQLTDTGCCCGIMPDDPVFGNWQEESATEQLVQLRDGRKKFLGPNDVIPEWAWDATLNNIVHPGVGPTAAWDHRHGRWAHKIREVWNKVDSQRGPLSYFQGAMLPDHYDDNGDLFYRWEGLKRQNLDSVPYWKVDV